MNEIGLHNVPLFLGLQENELKAISELVTRRKVPADTLILRADEEGDTLFVIQTGRVTVSVHGDDGRQVILSILTNGDFFGEISLLDGKPRSASVTATEDTELLLLRRMDFLSCMEQYPPIATKLLSALAMRLRRTNRQVESLALLNAYGRVAGVILQLAEDQGKRDIRDANRITLERPILQEIASMAGTTRETVSRTLRNFEEKGYIFRRGRRITIFNFEQLHDDFFYIP
jgi:CRP/FNR family transcriptional regulator/CRP/FNR family cyclic AMP-dependent transcriptional regulator